MLLLQQLLPLLRFDGYYVLSDLTGVPDILTRIKPIFRSLIRPREPEPRVAELKPWVRVVVTAYLILLIPALALLIAWIVMALPRMLATTYDSLGLQLDRVRAASGADEMAVGGFQMLALVMPVAAISVSLGRTGQRAAGGLVRWARRGRTQAAVAATGAVAVLAASAYVLWPNGDYEPIRPGERGTIGEAVKNIPKTVGGRPSFTPARAAEFAPVPTVREARTPLGPRDDAPPASERDGRETPAGPDEQDPPEDAGEGGGSPAPSGTTEPGSSAPTPSDTPEATATPDATAAPEATATPTATPEATATPAAEAGATG